MSERRNGLTYAEAGVDIDAGAVDTAKNALLQELAEADSTMPRQQRRSKVQAAVDPDLSRNILRGNALLAPDFCQGSGTGGLALFNWGVAFAEIDKTGGFQAVIGNPGLGCLFGRNRSFPWSIQPLTRPFGLL